MSAGEQVPLPPLSTHRPSLSAAPQVSPHARQDHVASQTTWQLRTRGRSDHVAAETTWQLRPRGSSDHVAAQTTWSLRPHDSSDHVATQTTWQLRPRGSSDHVAAQTTWSLFKPNHLLLLNVWFTMANSVTTTNKPDIIFKRFFLTCMVLAAEILKHTNENHIQYLNLILSHQVRISYKYIQIF